MCLQNIIATAFYRRNLFFLLSSQNLAGVAVIGAVDGDRGKNEGEKSGGEEGDKDRREIERKGFEHYKVFERGYKYRYDYRNTYSVAYGCPS